MSETTHTVESEHTNKLDTSTLAMPNAVIDFEAVVNGKHCVKVSFGKPHSQVSCIVTQFRDSEYKVVDASFERAEIRFSKEIDA
jgi:hypothetical protein